MRFRQKRDASDDVVVSAQRRVTIAELRAPNLDVLIGRTADEQLAVVAVGDGRYGQFMTEERECKGECVCVENLDRGVEQCGGEMSSRRPRMRAPSHRRRVAVRALIRE